MVESLNLGEVVINLFDYAPQLKTFILWSEIAEMGRIMDSPERRLVIWNSLGVTRIQIPP